MASGSVGLETYNRAKNACNSLTVSQLKAVLRSESQPLSGLKGALVVRLQNHLHDVYRRNDVVKWHRLANAILEPNGSSSSLQSSPASNSLSYSHSSHTGSYGTPPSWHTNSNGHGTVHMNFKESIFYEPVAKITSMQTLKTMDVSRGTHEFTCSLQPEWAAKFDRNAPDRDSYRLLLMGAGDPISSHIKLDIAYPHQFEVKINGMDVRGSWKGLKNKPGTTKPADITEFIRKPNGYDNTVTITYALTTKKFYLRIDLVKERSIQSLVQRLRDKKVLSKEQVLRDMRNRAMDSDIVATSTVMSLKCPITYIRIKNPCRGNQCSHNQCFDAISYLQLQQQAPTWTCPICNKPATFDNLQIDQYVGDILKSVPEDIEQVTISPEGEWTRTEPNENNHGVKSEDDSDDDDLIEVPRQSTNRLSMSHTSSTSQAITATPPVARAQEQASITAGSGKNANNKRPHEVVDLTLDSDEDESPAPKPTSGSAPFSQQNSYQSGYNQQSHSPTSNGYRTNSAAPVSFPFGQSRPPPPSRPPYNMHNSGFR